MQGLPSIIYKFILLLAIAQIYFIIYWHLLGHWINLVTNCWCKIAYNVIISCV